MVKIFETFEQLSELSNLELENVRRKISDGNDINAELYKLKIIKEELDLWKNELYRESSIMYNHLSELPDDISQNYFNKILEVDIKLDKVISINNEYFNLINNFTNQ